MKTHVFLFLVLATSGPTAVACADPKSPSPASEFLAAGTDTPLTLPLVIALPGNSSPPVNLYVSM